MKTGKAILNAGLVDCVAVFDEEAPKGTEDDRFNAIVRLGVNVAAERCPPASI
jgi:hypothetical protein